MTQTKRVCGVYEVRNAGGEFIIRGFKEDVAEVLGCKPEYVSSYASHDQLYKRKYQIKLVKKVDRNVEYTFKDEIDPNKMPDYLLVNITKYGNVGLPDGDPTIYLEYLKEKGFPCRAREAYYIDSRGKKQMFYIAEVCNDL